MTVRETTMSIIAIIFAISVGFVTKWDFAQLLSQESIASYFLIAGIIGSLGYGFRPRAEKFFERDEPKPNQIKKIITETSADKRKDLDEYSEHLKCDFLSLIESEMDEKKINSYYDAIKNLKKNKKMFLQHLYTFEKGGIISPPIYFRYQQARTTDGKLENAGMEISHLNSTFYSKAIEEFRKSRNFWTIDTDKLLNEIGIPKIDWFDKNINFDSIHPKHQSEISKNHFSYEKDVESYHGKLYKIKYGEEVVAKTDSKKVAKKLVQLLHKQCIHTTNKMNELLVMRRDNEKSIKPAVDIMFKEISESIKIGKPNVGICDACVGFYPFDRKIHYHEYLHEFNSSPWSWSDEHWC